MKTGTILLVILGAIGALVMSSIGKYNTLVSMEEDAAAAWSQVENVYQRRADLIPNLVQTVKGYASHEKETLQGVIEARSKVSQINLSSDALNDPNMLAKFQQAQSGLSSALSKLMVVVEKYPDLKANEGFLTLQSQLEGTENRIAVERRRYNEVAKVFNTFRRQFPTNLFAGFFGFKEKAYFESKEGSDNAPKVEF